VLGARASRDATLVPPDRRAVLARQQAALNKVERARVAYDAWASRDLDAFVEVFSEDVELRPFLGRGLGSTTYRGHEGLRRWYEEATEEWDELVIEPYEFIERGDHLVIFLRAVGRGRGSHVEVSAEIVHVAEFRDGKFIRLDGFGDREQALEALEAKQR
jgi:ketosteroid isomerase-like protein